MEPPETSLDLPLHMFECFFSQVSEFHKFMEATFDRV